jgi:hypothetical protein
MPFEFFSGYGLITKPLKLVEEFIQCPAVTEERT